MSEKRRKKKNNLRFAVPLVDPRLTPGTPPPPIMPPRAEPVPPVPAAAIIVPAITPPDTPPCSSSPPLVPLVLPVTRPPLIEFMFPRLPPPPPPMAAPTAPSPTPTFDSSLDDSPLDAESSVPLDASLVVIGEARLKFHRRSLEIGWHKGKDNLRKLRRLCFFNISLVPHLRLVQQNLSNCFSCNL